MRRSIAVLVFVSLFVGVPATAQDSPRERQATAYLETALAALETQHINRASVDWPILRAQAHALARGATTPAETHAAIEHVIAVLGEKHTVLHPAPDRSPARPEAPGSAAPAPFRMPEPSGELIDGRIGYLRLPTFGAPVDHPDADLFVAMTRRILLNHDRAGVCGWIVDLRGNTGGNVWPMVDGLLPLLAPRIPAGPYWSFDIDGAVTPVTMADGRMVGEGVPERPVYGLRLAGHADAPIAILIDGETASSAEVVAGVFHGLPDVRYFGATTADYVTVNNPVQLPDGASIQMTIGYTVRRDGTRQTGPFVPDEPTPGALAREAAVRWLSARECLDGAAAGGQ